GGIRGRGRGHHLAAESAGEEPGQAESVLRQFRRGGSRSPIVSAELRPMPRQRWHRPRQETQPPLRPHSERHSRRAGMAADQWQHEKWHALMVSSPGRAALADCHLCKEFALTQKRHVRQHVSFAKPTKLVCEKNGRYFAGFCSGATAGLANLESSIGMFCCTCST